DLDIVSAHDNDSYVFWVAHLDGAGTFATTPASSAFSIRPLNIAVADFDGDSDLDIAAVSYETDEIVWHANTDGLGALGPAQATGHVESDVFSFQAADLDSDGDIDLLTTSHEDDSVGWYENTDGLGSFASRVNLPAGAALYAFAFDLDRDGDLDVLTSRPTEGLLLWCENTDGAGTFAAAAAMPGAEVISGRLDAADVDGDFDLDLLVANAATGAAEVLLNKSDDCNGDRIPDECQLAGNDCNGNGVPDDCEPDDDCNGNAVRDICEIGAAETDCNGNAIPDSCELSENDCNASGRLDICEILDGLVDDCNVNGIPDSCELLGNDCNDNGVPDDCDVAMSDCNGNGVPDDCELLDNDCNANGVPDDCEIALHDCDRNGVPDSCELAAGDCDGNGILDACETLVTFDIQEVVDAGNVSDLASGDIDNDGDADIVIADGHDEFFWFETVEGAVFGERRLVGEVESDYDFSNAPVALGDFDGDGDMDVAASTGGLNPGLKSIVWFENLDGRGAFGPPRHRTISLSGASSIAAVDVDGDGDIDLVAGFCGADTLCWFENLDGLGQFSGPRIVSNTLDCVSGLVAADFDNDGDVDVAVAAASEDHIRYFRNADGHGAFELRPIVDTIDSPRSLVAVDMDRDSDLDLVAAASWGRRVTWYENTDGQGSFGPRNTIAAPGDDTIYVAACDIDRDGDMDVISTLRVRKQVVWHENRDGSQQFWTQRMILDIGRLPTGVLADDLDGDFMPDVLCRIDGGALEDLQLARNTTEDCNLNGLPDRCDLAGNDADNDGVPDDCGEIPGDINNDRSVDAMDVALFVKALVGANAQPIVLARADLNDDSVVNGADIAPFIDAMIGG
ncbi:MAG TPA: FG-GAP-like repeat-containing protein, partial [Phycisphaerae bacterium]|nr:FG-GAP-like repeat-containing protein [Phycisphaerae bacterium]